MSASKIVFRLNAWVFCTLAIDTMAMGTSPSEYPLSIYPKSILDSYITQIHSLQSLDPIESDLMPRNSISSSPCGVAQDQAYRSCDRLNRGVFDPPVKRARLGEDMDFQCDTALDTERIPGDFFYSSASETESRNPSFDRFLNGQPTPCMGADVHRRLPLTGADGSDRPHDYQGLMDEKGPSETEFHSRTDPVHSIPESGHRKYTTENVERDVSIDLKDFFTEDVQLKPLDARRVPLELVFPYFEQLETKINSLYKGRASGERQLISKCGELPIATYKYRTPHSKATFRVVNVITDAKGNAVTSRKLIQNLHVLIRWFFYGHSKLLEHLNLNSEEKSRNQRQACSWFLAQIFEPKKGAQIFKEYPDEIGKIIFDFDRVQSLLIKIISGYNVEKKSPGASIFLLECCYQEIYPKTWKEILHEEESFTFLMRKLLIEGKIIPNKTVSNSYGIWEVPNQNKRLQCEFDNTKYKISTFSKTFSRYFPCAGVINQMRGSHLTHSRIFGIERSIEERISSFFDQICKHTFKKKMQSIPEIHIQSIMYKNQLGILFFALEFVDNSNQARYDKSVVLKNIVMIMSVAGYIHSKTLSNLPSSISNKGDYSYESFLKWLEGIFFSNKDGGIPIFRSVRPGDIKTKDIILSSAQRYIIQNICKFKRKIHSAIIGIAVYQYWLHEECQIIWNFFSRENVFPQLIESFFSDLKEKC